MSGKSDYNFISMTEILKNFPITQHEYARLVSSGKLKMIRRKGVLKHTLQSVFEYFYPDNEKTIVKKWSYPYEDIGERWRIICDKLRLFPKSFMMLGEEHERGIYRVYDRNAVLRIFLFVEGRECTILAFDRNAELDFKRFHYAELTWI